MASLVTDPDGTRRILFVSPDKKRRTLRLGKIRQRQAEQVLMRVELLQTAIETQTPPDQATAQWVADISNELHSKLAAVGLVKERESNSHTVAGFIREYITGRTDLKGRTRNNLEQAAGYIVEFFGSTKLLSGVVPGDGDELRRWMLNRLSENTAARHLGRLRQFFRAAYRKRLIPVDPFEDLKGCGMRSVRSRTVFIDEQHSLKILAECPSLEWRVIWSLARWGGLRMPSEGIRLTWADIDFEAGTMLVHSPKTEHHDGHDMRLVPLFPQVRQLLEELRDQVQPDIDAPMSAAVIQGFHRETNWRTKFNRMLAKAGLSSLPKPFVNARSTRATELAETFPGHVAAAWLGHSEKVANKFYRQVTEDHLKRATKAVQNPVQSMQQQDGIGQSRPIVPFRIPENSEAFHHNSDHKYPRHDSNVRPAV